MNKFYEILCLGCMGGGSVLTTYYLFFSFSHVSHPADDCQQMFLHPVNVRCLLREYGSLEASPDSITATVVEIDGHTVTEVSKHKHIPDAILIISV